MRIALDTLGGKYAPDAIVEGAIRATQRWEGLTVTLVGDPARLMKQVNALHGDLSRFTFRQSRRRISEAENPVTASEAKPDASILVALEEHRRGEVDAVVSAGSTGAQIIASIKKLGLLEGVLRPAIGSYFPSRAGRTFILDVGATAACRPIHLLQFAAMGAIFRRLLDGIENPRIALLSNGEESSKGTQTTRDAYELLKVVSELNFVGYIEGRDIHNGSADVVVCDGFVGNILLKFAETIPDMLKNCCADENLEVDAVRSLYDRLIRTFDYQEFGGVPLLGVNGVSIICHGDSSAKAITNAVGEAIKMAKLQVNDKIAEQLSTMGHWSAVIKTKALIERFRRRRASGEKN